MKRIAAAEKVKHFFLRLESRGILLAGDLAGRPPPLPRQAESAVLSGPEKKQGFPCCKIETDAVFLESG